MILVDARSNLALLSIVDGLVLEVLALGTEASRRIHALLEFIVLPAKHVVTVLAETSVVTVAEIEGLRAVGGPDALVIEGSGVPYDLVHQLGNADGVAGWAAASKTEEVGGTGGWVGNMSLVIGRIEVLAVPATVSS